MTIATQLNTPLQTFDNAATKTTTTVTFDLTVGKRLHTTSFSYLFCENQKGNIFTFQWPTTLLVNMKAFFLVKMLASQPLAMYSTLKLEYTIGIFLEFGILQCR